MKIIDAGSLGVNGVPVEVLDILVPWAAWVCAGRMRHGLADRLGTGLLTGVGRNTGRVALECVVKGSWLG